VVEAAAHSGVGLGGGTSTDHGGVGLQCLLGLVKPVTGRSSMIPGEDARDLVQAAMDPVPVTVHFKREPQGWKLVGVERLP